MNKLLLHRDDIKILDYIVSECLKQGVVRVENLKLLKNGLFDDVEDLRESQYLRYFAIIKEFNVAEVTTLGSTFVKAYEIETNRFYEDGGFEKLYEIQQKEIEHTMRQKEKEVNEAILSKWHKKTYWWTFGIAIAGFIVAGIALYIAINQK